MLQGWNWYAGADPTLIGASQYDFQTVVTHEFGHALGLGGDTDPTSPMYETLGTAQIRRVLTLQDLNLADAPAGPDPERAAPAPWATIYLEGADLSGIDLTITPGYQTGSNPRGAQQTALNAVLANWLSGTDLTGQVDRSLDNGQFNRALNWLGAASLNDPDDFWSTIAAGMAMDKLIDLSRDFGR